jgi:hypothetical protein
MKSLIKFLLTRLACIIYHLKYPKGLYLGLGTKIVQLGEKRILLPKNVKIMRYSMLHCAGNGAKLEIGEISIIGGCFLGLLQIVGLGLKNFFSGPEILIADFNHGYENVGKSIMDQCEVF